MPTQPKISDKPALTGRSDFKSWYTVLKRHSTTWQVWDFVNPELSPNDLKELVEPPDEPASTNVGTVTVWKEKRKRHRMDLEKLGKLEQYITETIDSKLLDLFLDSDTIADQIRKLYNLFNQSAVEKQLDAIQEYDKAKKYYPRRSSIEDWCNEFLRAYTKAVQLKAPGVQGFMPQRDLLKVFNQVNSGYAAVVQITVKTEEAKYVEATLNPTTGSSTLRSTPATDPATIPRHVSIQTMIEDFLQADYLHQKPHHVSGSAFATTLNGEQSPYENRRRSHLNPRTERTPCPCGDGDSHSKYWGKCPYISPCLQGKTFKKDPNRVRKVAEYENSHPQRKRIFDNIRRRNKNRQSENSKTRSHSVVIDGGDQPEDTGSPHQSYVSHYSAFGNHTIRSSPLLHSWTLDPASDLHVCNNANEFTWKRPATDDDILLAGETISSIEAWGECRISLQTLHGIKQTTLKNVALIPNFFTSLVSLSRLKSSKVYFDSGRDCLYRKNEHEDSDVVALLTPCGGHWLVQSRTEPATITKPNQPYLAHATKQRKTSYKPLPSRKLTGLEAHVLMGHPGQEPIQHLPDNVIGIDSLTSDPPSKSNCAQCSANKATQLISRRSDRERGATRPFESLAIDIIEMDTTALTGDRYVFHAYDLVTKFNFVVTIRDRSKGSLKAALVTINNLIKREFNIVPTFILLDGERGFGFEDSDSLVSHCKDEGIQLQLRSADTPAQSGHIERSGRIIIERSRSLYVMSNLPIFLIAEIYRYAGYLANRTPVKSLDWKTPFEKAYGKKPSLAHLKNYGCRAFALRKKIPRTDKLSPRAVIGYLVGLDSRNIYRIWIPKASSRGHRGKVIRTRDVTFDEKLFYESDDTIPLQGEELRETINIIEIPDHSESEADASATSSESENEVVDEEPGALSTHIPSTTSLFRHDLQHTPSSPSSIHENPYLTPISMNSPKSTEQNGSSTKRKRSTNTHLKSSNIMPEGSKRKRYTANAISTYWSTFVASSFALKTRIHRSQLPSEPRFWSGMMKLPEIYKQGFLNACRKELDTIKRKNTYVKRHLQELDTAELEILPLTWVFKYKFDSEGFLLKYKARICVRGDLQTKVEDTHAATLAIRTFRALMAIAGYFNLEIRQYDAVNAFTNAKLSNPVYCYEPEGFSDGLHIWELQRALYGLRTSPKLWYKELTSTLKSFGLSPVLDCNCLWKNDRIIVFFYVDDIITMARPGHSSALDNFERKLMNRYEITNLKDCKVTTFCGITAHRDRENGDMWLCQQDYIETIFHRYPNPKPLDKPPFTPLPFEELVPSSEVKNEANIHRYAQIVGSIGYSAGATRPDIAKAHSKLAEFLINPSSKHIYAAYHCLAYLYHTRTSALHYSASLNDHTIHISDQNEPDFFGATDASYADHRATRKSSQGYIFFLFGGPIDWKATLQRCVTKSTTEAELIAASSAGTELIWWWRVFKDLGVQPDNDQLLFCDNQQTIRLITAEAPKLNTTLRHVDIHHHWLRQASQNKTIDVAYIPTKLQPADGLTKLLPKQRHMDWVALLNFDTVPPTPRVQTSPNTSTSASTSTQA